jgi:hypothetical protein
MIITAKTLVGEVITMEVDSPLIFCKKYMKEYVNREKRNYTEVLLLENEYLMINTYPIWVELYHELMKKPEYFYDLCNNPSPGAVELVSQFPERIDWCSLSKNRYAIHLLEQNLDKVDWKNLSANPSAIQLLEQHLDKVHWPYLSLNPAAITLLEQNQDKIHWRNLSLNPGAVSLLEKNIDRIDLYNLALNPGAIDLLSRIMIYPSCRAILHNLCANKGAGRLLKLYAAQNPESMDWEELSRNPGAIEVLVQHQSHIDWYAFCENPAAVNYLKNSKDVDWEALCENPAAGKLIHRRLTKENIRASLYRNPCISVQ